MSAWGEAVWVVKHLKTSLSEYFDLDAKAAELNKREAIMDDSSTSNTPISHATTDFATNSVWFVTQDER